MVQEGVEADGETFLPLAESHADTQPEPPLEAKQDTSQHHHSSLAGAPSLSALLEQAWKEASDQVPAKPTPAKAKPSSGYDWDDDDDEEDMRTPDMRTPEPIQTSHERRVLATRSLDNVVEEEHEEEEEEQADVVVEREPEATDAHPDAYLQAAAAHWGAASYSKAEQGLQAAGNGHDGGQNGGVPAQHTPSSSSGDGSAYGSAFEDDLDDDEFNPQLDTSHRGGAAAGDVSGGGATAAVAIAAAVAGLTSASAGQLPLPPASAVLTTNSAPESSPPVLAQQQSQGAGMGVAAAVAGALPQAPPPPADIDAWQCLVDLPLHITARVFAFAGISPLPLPGAGRVFKRMLQLDETCAIWLASRYGLCEGFARAAGAGRGRLMAHLMALGAGQDQETLGAALEAAAGNGQEHVVGGRGLESLAVGCTQLCGHTVLLVGVWQRLWEAVMTIVRCCNVMLCRSVLCFAACPPCCRLQPGQLAPHIALHVRQPTPLTHVEPSLSPSPLPNSPPLCRWTSCWPWAPLCTPTTTPRCVRRPAAATCPSCAPCLPQAPTCTRCRRMHCARPPPRALRVRWTCCWRRAPTPQHRAAPSRVPPSTGTCAWWGGFWRGARGATPTSWTLRCVPLRARATPMW